MIDENEFKRLEKEIISIEKKMEKDRMKNCFFNIIFLFGLVTFIVFMLFTTWSYILK